MSLTVRIAVASALVFSVGCRGESAPISAPVAVPVPTGSDPSILAAHGPLFAASGAPAIANPVVSFWAKRGRSSEVFMYYQSLPGATDSAVFIRFRVPKRALWQYPNGQPFHPGDSVQITLTLTDAVHLVVEFQPTGLVFNPAEPATLKMSYLETDPDIDQDGDVDATDLALQAQIRIWKKDPGTRWMRLIGLNDESLHEVESNVFGFTSYALAY